MRKSGNITWNKVVFQKIMFKKIQELEISFSELANIMKIKNEKIDIRYQSKKLQNVWEKWNPNIILKNLVRLDKTTSLLGEKKIWKKGLVRTRDIVLAVNASTFKVNALNAAVNASTFKEISAAIILIPM